MLHDLCHPCFIVFPYTTLFRSVAASTGSAGGRRRGGTVLGSGSRWSAWRLIPATRATRGRPPSPSGRRAGRPAAHAEPAAGPIHAMDADPIFVNEGDLDAARALVESAEHAELFLYPGDQHYFADSSVPSYDADAAALLTRRVLDFLRDR